jgi:3-isopropylmalate dehydratase small subunit
MTSMSDTTTRQTAPTTWKLLYLGTDPHLVRRQLAGEHLLRADAGPLRDDVSTDEITPVAILGHYDARLGDFAHTGLRCGTDNPVGTGDLRRAQCAVLVAGRRYGKGSSREHSPTAELLSGVRLVIAESFERLYRQNADNIGLFTSTEAGAVGALLSFVIAWAKGTLTREALTRSVVETLVTCASVFIVVIGASMLTSFLTLTGIAGAISEAAQALNTSPVMLLVAITLVYLFLGMFLEPIGAMLITLPIFLPLIGIAKIDIIWFGVFVAKLVEIGMITPPVGLNVFVLSSTIGKSAPTDLIFRGVMWFFVADLVVVALVIAVPGIIMFLPRYFS